MTKPEYDALRLEAQRAFVTLLGELVKDGLIKDFSEDRAVMRGPSSRMFFEAYTWPNETVGAKSQSRLRLLDFAAQQAQILNYRVTDVSVTTKEVALKPSYELVLIELLPRE